MVQGIAGVFCDPELRGRGYASRMMRDLARVLRRWQEDEEIKSVGSVLWSDIGRKFYADCGWAPFPSHHVEFPSSQAPGLKDLEAKMVLEEDIGQLCTEDENL
jgi:predicted acetyltransferase